ncbi:sigma-70 family RNA polymerase sigma factor [Streptomyces sp. NPDC089799]|uniref:sigma-70 family RNA polymerase sigma factor n=1 Tax=Streptomyces sp. NPDC089799 TaxID=3155066 RepID=UPI003439232A
MVAGKAPRKQAPRPRADKPLAAVEAAGPGEGEDDNEWARSPLAERLDVEARSFMEREPLVLRAKTGGKLSLPACQDAVAQAVCNVTARLRDGLLDESVNLPAYLRKTAWNLAVDQLTADARVELAGDEVESAATLAPPPEQVAVGDVDPLQDLVLPAIDALPPSQRRQVVRLQSQGLNDIEIAAALGIRADRLHRERHNAVVELRGALRAFIRDGHRKATGRWKKDR